MLIICDFDGTATQIEPLEYLARQFAPDSVAQYEDLIHGEQGNLHAVLAAGLAESSVTADVLVSTLLHGVPLRPGFREFCETVQRDGHRLFIVSAGFTQLIMPLIMAAGISDVEVIANEIRVSETGSLSAHFRPLPTCDDCGQTCKRADITRLQEDGELVVMVGDGYSDRCAAIHQADIVYATGILPGFLDEAGVTYHPFTTFNEVLDHLTVATASTS